MAVSHQKSSFSTLFWASTVYPRVFTPTMLLQEVILCSTSPQQPTVGAGAIVVHDIQTGAILASFKQTNAGPKSVAVLESKSTQGGFILAAQLDKSIMNVYNYQKVSLALHMPAISNGPQPGSTSLEDRSPRKAQLHRCRQPGGFLHSWNFPRACISLGGELLLVLVRSVSSEVKISSGILYNAWDAHYSSVNVLQFTQDGAALVSGSDDSGVSVWSVSRSIRPLHPSYFVAKSLHA